MALEKFPIEAGHIRMFAYAVGDKNPIYYDEAYAKGTEPGSIIAPPTFVQASFWYDPECRARPKIGQPWMGSGKEPSGIKEAPAFRGLHAEQHYTYFRHPKAGDVFTVIVKDGKTWEKEGKRGGKLLFRETITEYRDQKGELVVEARSVGVTTEKAPD